MSLDYAKWYAQQQRKMEGSEVMGKNKRLGIYEFGYLKFEVFVDPSQKGGEFWCLGANGNAHPRMVIGTGWHKGDWHMLLSVVMHEAVEAVLTFRGDRFRPDPQMNSGHDSYIFHFDHKEFNEVMVWVADGLSKLVPDLRAEFLASKKPRTKKIPVVFDL